MTDTPKPAALPSGTWEALFERFAEFQAMPCLMSPGPDTKRPDRAALLKRLLRHYALVRDLLPGNPADVTQTHINDLLRQRGISTRGSSSRPDAQAFWSGFWRALILDRDDYRCGYCRRSAEKGVQVAETLFALRLELDHFVPRSRDGEDYDLTNIRTMCRLCNVVRGRLKDEYFEADMLSLCAALAEKHRPSGA